MTDSLILEKFITNALLSEEIWLLRDVDGWVIANKTNDQQLTIWTTNSLAIASAGTGQSADAVSLEHFIYQELDELHRDGVRISLVADEESRPLLLDAATLYHLLDRKLDSEQYFLEG